MFEKEAEEIAKDIYIHHFDDDVNYPEVLKAITVGVQKGAEFGYNKAKEEHKQDELGLIISNSSARAELEKQLEQLLKELIDRGIIYEWYVNGDGYHWSYVKIKSEVVTIEQNAGKNTIEGGVVSVSGSVSKHRPFKNCDELKKHYLNLYKKKVGIVPVDSGLDVPYIWVRQKYCKTENLIIAFDNHIKVDGKDTSCVSIQDMWLDMEDLVDRFEFLDGSPCGVEE